MWFVDIYLLRFIFTNRAYSRNENKQTNKQIGLIGSSFSLYNWFEGSQETLFLQSSLLWGLKMVILCCMCFLYSSTITWLFAKLLLVYICFFVLSIFKLICFAYPDYLLCLAIHETENEKRFLTHNLSIRHESYQILEVSYQGCSKKSTFSTLTNLVLLGSSH